MSLKINKKKVILLAVSIFAMLFFCISFNTINAKADTEEHVTYDETDNTLIIQGELSDDDIYRIRSYRFSVNNVLIKNAKISDCYGLFSEFSELKNVDIDGLETTCTASMFSECKLLESVSGKNFDTSKVTDMSRMFYKCNSLKNIDVGNFDVSNVTDMQYMFCECSSLEYIDVKNFDVSKVTNMQFMFYECSQLTKLETENFDVSNVTDMQYMFYGCSSLEEIAVENFNVSKVTNMKYMFSECSKLTKLHTEDFDVSSVTDMRYMFKNCYNLEEVFTENWNVSKVDSMRCMFDCCRKLTRIYVGKWDVSNVTDMEGMFYECEELKEIQAENWNVSNVIYMDSMFCKCSSLKKLSIGNWDISKVDHYSHMIEECNSLKLIVLNNWKEENIKKIDCYLYNIYTIVFKSGKEKIRDDVTIYAKGEEAALNYIGEEIPGYTFKSKVKVDDRTIEYRYVKPHKVIFKDENSNIIKEEVIIDDDNIEFPEDPIKEATEDYIYTFVKWEKYINEETGDIEFTPVFDKKVNIVYLKLSITMSNDKVKFYILTDKEVDKFIEWYDLRSEGKGKAYYIFENKASDYNKASKDYIPYDKIEYFNVEEVDS